MWRSPNPDVAMDQMSYSEKYLLDSVKLVHQFQLLHNTVISTTSQFLHRFQLKEISPSIQTVNLLRDSLTPLTHPTSSSSTQESTQSTLAHQQPSPDKYSFSLVESLFRELVMEAVQVLSRIMDLLLLVLQQVRLSISETILPQQQLHLNPYRVELN